MSGLAAILCGLLVAQTSLVGAEIWMGASAGWQPVNQACLAVTVGAWLVVFTCWLRSLA